MSHLSAGRRERPELVTDGASEHDQAIRVLSERGQPITREKVAATIREMRRTRRRREALSRASWGVG